MTAFVICGGPSLKGFDLAQIRGRGRVIAVNAAGYQAPWADLLVFTDHSFFTAHSRMVASFGGDVWTLSRRSNEQGGIPRAFQAHHARLGAGVHPLPMSANSGQFGLACAISLGASRIVMLGFDLKLAPDGTSHCHPHYGGPHRNAVQPHFVDMLSGWGEQAREAGVFVLNASPDSATNEFLKCRLETLFDEVQG